MRKARRVRIGYVVKHPKTGKFASDDRDEFVTLEDAEQFFTKRDAKNFRDMLACYTSIPILEVVKVRETIEEV